MKLRLTIVDPSCGKIRYNFTFILGIITVKRSKDNKSKITYTNIKQCETMLETIKIRYLFNIIKYSINIIYLTACDLAANITF